MRIGLIDCDSHNFPNLPLMKISSFYKRAGEEVKFASLDKYYDELFVSKVFTESEEPPLPVYGVLHRGGSGYDLENRLPDEIEHCYPDYSLYPELTAETAFGFLTRGCPRKGHSFCITPKKDGCRSRKVADLSEFWHGQKNIVLLDQNLLACPERMELLGQLAESGASVEFNGGMDVRLLNEEIIGALRNIRVRNYWFAWDDPREHLEDKFRLFSQSGLRGNGKCRVYVLTNYWSTMDENLNRVYQLRRMGFFPFIMIYDKQKYRDSHGRWLPDVAKRYSEVQMRNFKICQHMKEDAEGYICDVTVGGQHSWYMLGHAFWDERFSRKFIEILEKIYEKPETGNLLWESIYMVHLQELRMKIRKYGDGLIYEFDTLDELRDFDSSYIEDTRSEILKTIDARMGCRERDIVKVNSFKDSDNAAAGFTFEVAGRQFEFRYVQKSVRRIS